MTPDFSLLYSQLDLRPDCSLEEFRSAYVRRIAELHPDRTGSQPLSSEAQATLRELVSTYVAVTRFHRRYGRMPGGAPYAAAQHQHSPAAQHDADDDAAIGPRNPTVSGRRPALQGGPAAYNPMMTAVRPALQVPIHSGDEPPRHSRATLRLVLIIVTLGLLLAGWDLSGLPLP